MTDEPKEPPVPMSDDVMQRTAQNNLRHYINTATWKCSADKDAALACVDVYDEDFTKMAVRLVNALADQDGRPDTPPGDTGGARVSRRGAPAEPTPDPFVEAAEEAFVALFDERTFAEYPEDMDKLIALARRGAELGAAREREEIVRHLRWVAEGLDEETRVAAAHVRRCIASAIESRAHMGGK